MATDRTLPFVMVQFVDEVVDASRTRVDPVGFALARVVEPSVLFCTRRNFRFTSCIATCCVDSQQLAS
jgi:hypothetical protein